MNLSQLVSRFYMEFREIAGNSRFTESEVKIWLNEGYQDILNELNWKLTEKTAFRTNIFTACSDAGDSTGTTLYVDSSAGIQVGQYLYVFDSSNYEKVQVESISANTITLVSPGLVNTYTDGDTVSSNQIYIPWDMLTIQSIVCERKDSTVHSASQIYPVSETESEYREPLIESSGTPANYSFNAIDLTAEESLSAEEGTDSTSIVCTGLSSTEDNYYQGWLVINQTNDEGSRVRSYDGTTQTLTIYSSIASQDSDDSFSIIKDMLSISLDCIPDRAYTYKIRYNSMYELVNDYDMPKFDPIHHQTIVEYALWRAYISDKYGYDSGEQSQKRYELYRRGLQKIKNNIYHPSPGCLSMRTQRQARYDAPTSPYGR